MCRNAAFGLTAARRLYCAGLLTLALLVTSFPALAFTWIEVAKLQSQDGNDSLAFGNSMAVDGGTAIIGDWRAGEEGSDVGAAYVFTRDASGNWTEQAKLLASNGGDFVEFGFSVDIDGDTAIVGTLEDDLQSAPNAAYVFTRDSSGNWSEQGVLEASDGIFGDGFGFSVAVDGDTAFVGTRPEVPFVVLTGAVYVFTRDASGSWTEQAKLLASDGTINDGFGQFIDLDGDRAIVGRPGSDGSAYVFARDAFGIWTEQAKLVASAPTSSENGFGRPVAVDGNTAIVGSAEGESGSAYVFRLGASGTWSQEAKLTSSASFDRFATWVALSGPIAVVGAPNDVDNGIGSNRGSAYVFSRDASGNWSEQAKLLASDGASNDFFGRVVGIDGKTVVVSGRQSAYVFQLAEAILVEIDIRPGNKQNNIHPHSKGQIWVVLLSDTDSPFDPLQIKIRSVRFGPGEAKAIQHKVKDVNRDGLGDLLLRFEIHRTSIECGDTNAVLSGVTFDKQKVRGVDFVKTVGCN